MLVKFGEAVELVGETMKCRIDHAQRLKDALRQKVLERHIRQHLHQIAADIGGEAVIPASAGLVAQRQLGQAQYHLFQRDILAAHQRLAVHVFYGRVIEEAIAQASGVRQQVVDGHGRTLRRILRAHIANTGHDFAVAKSRDVAADWLEELECAFFIEHHQRDRGDRLGHAVDAEDGVALHGQRIFGIAPATGFKMRNLAIPRQQRHESGCLLLVDIGLQAAVDAAQAL